jgi:protein-disulfide isomerase
MDDNFREFFQKNFLAFSILIAAGLISGAIFYTDYKQSLPGLGGSNISVPALEPSPQTIAIEVGDLPIQGRTDAPVTIVEFGDYQCSFCGKFSREVEPKIISEYVNTGKAKFAWRDLAFLGEESIWAAEASRCARDQGKFWEYNRLLFEKQQGGTRGTFSKENLKLFAKELKLNESLFSSCLDSEKYRRKVEEETSKALELGVNSTPTTFINNRKIIGAQPYEVFKEAIETELNKVNK